MFAVVVFCCCFLFVCFFHRKLIHFFIINPYIKFIINPYIKTCTSQTPRSLKFYGECKS